MFNLHPDAIEEMNHSVNARADYLSEAFGGEARMLAAQARDEEAECMGFLNWEAQQAAGRDWVSRRRASESIARSKTVNRDEVPF